MKLAIVVRRPCELPARTVVATLLYSPLTLHDVLDRKAAASEPVTMAKENRPLVVLIDAMGFIFRAFFAPMERLRSPSGVPTKVPYVFASMLRRLVHDWQPDYMGVVFDAAAPTFRDQLYEQYKAKRPPMPDELAVQLPYVRRLCEAARLPILEFPGYEADDVIGALACQAVDQGLEVVIVTSDKDMLQLVGKGIRVLIPTKGDLVVDARKVEELLGVPPQKVADVMALMGDLIDNIPGARGIGREGARELIRRFGSAEAALEHAAEVANKRYREALQSQRDQVLLSKQLATIATAIPVPLELERLRRAEPDYAALRGLYAELGFTSLLKELMAQGPVVRLEKVEYETLGSAAELRAFVNSLSPGQAVAVWPVLQLAEGEEPGFDSRVVGLELSTATGTARVAQIPAGQEHEVFAGLRSWLEEAARPKVTHDPKLLEMLLGPVRGIRDATMLYSYLLQPTTANHDFSEVVLRRLNVALSGAPGERADYLLRIAPLLRAEVEARGLLEVYEKIDLPLAPVLATMERRGVRVDPAALAELSAAMEEEARALERRIYELAGREFNVNSPQQLAEVLFDELQLPMPRKYGRAKARSTAVSVLQELALVHELPRKVIEYREQAKLKSTYADALPRLIHPRTGRLHTRLSQVGTATGRLSSANPNLQNIPIRTELGRKIRAAFVAEPGWRLLSADYSQIELRILAHFSQDAVLAEAFRCGEDIHALTAAEVFGVAPGLQTAEHRRVAKIINFGILYGLSPFGLAQQLGISQKEAAQFIAAYFERYPGVRAYLDGQLAEVRRTGLTRTLFGRIRPIPEINSPIPARRNLAERTALNTPFQGSAADLIKLAMIEIHRRLAQQGLRAKMILQVHDELLFEAPEEEIPALAALVKPAMEQIETFAGPLRVPLAVDIKTGSNWRDLS